MDDEPKPLDDYTGLPPDPRPKAPFPGCLTAAGVVVLAIVLWSLLMVGR